MEGALSLAMSSDREGARGRVGSADRVGLCVRCVHADAVTSARGSTFWRCRVSEHDRSFPKYPPLPVVDCAAFLVKTEAAD